MRPAFKEASTAVDIISSVLLFDIARSGWTPQIKASFRITLAWGVTATTGA